MTVTDGEGTETEYQYNTSTKQYTIKETLDTTTYTTTYNLTNEKTISSISFPDGTSSTFTYDNLNRPKQITTSNGATSSSILVKADSMGSPREVQATLEDSSTQTTSYYYNSDISLNKIVEPDLKELDLDYDKALRVTALKRNTGTGQSATSQSYDYNDASQLTSTAMGSHVTASYGYNKDGQLRFKKLNNKVITIYTYATDGRLSKLEHKRDASDNTTYSTSTDALSNTSDDVILDSIEYTFNNDNLITEKIRKMYNSSGTLQRTVRLTAAYDLRGRLVEEKYYGG